MADGVMSVFLIPRLVQYPYLHVFLNTFRPNQGRPIGLFPAVELEEFNPCIKVRGEVIYVRLNVAC